MDEKKEGDVSKEFREFEENPYNPDRKKPEDIVRLFYINNVSLLPVVSKRGSLLGILIKDDVVSELSDIERVKSQKIDQFVTKLVKKISLDDLLPLAGHIREYIVINLFGEVQGKWSRLDLFAACEGDGKGRNLEGDIAKQKEEQVLEWMIYLILEHIPRPLFAMNQKGKTIFYNSHFEDLFTKELGADTDIKFIEDSLGNPDRNEFFFRKKGSKEVYFYNKDLKFYYEKAQLVSGEKPVGFLVYGDRSLAERENLPFPGVNVQGLPLNDIIASTERTLIVNALKEKNNNLKEAARNLKITLPALQARIKKHRIKTGLPAEKKKKPERGARKGRIKK